MTGTTVLDYARILKNIVTACRATTTITNLDVVSDFKTWKALGSAAAFSQGPFFPNDNSESSWNYRVPINILARGKGKDAAIASANEIVDALTYWVKHGHSKNQSITGTSVSATDSTLSTTTIRMGNAYRIFTGSTISPWTQLVATVSLESSYENRQKVLKVLKSTTNESEAFYSFGTHSSATEVSFDIRCGQADHGIEIFLWSGATIAIEVRFANTGQIQYRESGGTWTDIQAYSANTWYRIAYKNIDCDTDTYDLYINGASVATGLHFRNVVSSVNAFNLKITGGSADNSTVYMANQYYSWNDNTENCFIRFSMPIIPIDATIVLANLAWTTSEVVENDGHVQCNGLKNTIGTFITAAEVNGYSLTTAQIDDQEVGTSNTYDVITILQENATAGQMITSGLRTGFKLAAETNYLVCVLSNATLTLEYTIANAPRKLYIRRIGQPIQTENALWEIMIGVEMSYRAISKVIT